MPTVQEVADTSFSEEEVRALQEILSNPLLRRYIAAAEALALTELASVPYLDANAEVLARQHANIQGKLLAITCLKHNPISLLTGN